MYETRQPEPPEMTAPHPLDQLRASEISTARDVVVAKFPDSVVQFRSLYLEEPTKASLVEFLRAEHNGTLGNGTPRPPRLAKIEYDVHANKKKHDYTESIVDITLKKEVSRETMGPDCQASLTV